MLSIKATARLALDKVLPFERLLLGLAQAFAEKETIRQFSLFSHFILSCRFKAGVKN